MKAKIKEIFIPRSILNLDGKYTKTEFRVKYHFVPEVPDTITCEGTGADVNILDIKEIAWKPNAENTGFIPVTHLLPDAPFENYILDYEQNY